MFSLKQFSIWPSVRYWLGRNKSRAPEPRPVRDDVQIRQWIQDLPSRQRMLLLDHVERGLNYRQIARERGMTDKIVLRELSRAYSTLRIRDMCRPQSESREE